MRKIPVIVTSWARRTFTLNLGKDLVLYVHSIYSPKIDVVKAVELVSA